MKQFSDASYSVGHGTLTSTRSDIAAGSDGTQVMFGGGALGQSSNTCDMKQFADWWLDAMEAIHLQGADEMLKYMRLKESEEASN